MYSVEIRVERDKVTGETRVLSANPTLPVDPGLGVKVYEDERKVVHEMNGEDGGHILSSTEVEELIHKADEAYTITTITKTTTTTVTAAENPQDEPEEPRTVDVSAVSSSSVEITGLEAKPEKEPSVSDATEENPVTMVFMGYQNVEDEDETKRVLGLKGTVKAELVVIEDGEGKTSPVEKKTPEKSAQKAAENSPKEKEEKSSSPERKNGETAAVSSEEEVRAAETDETQKKKQPCKCCVVM
ncbi:hypothetical protein WMY93_024686 [Mugilogobius chulae]|uniref:Paralemmin-1 n=1 Tax=Mugilogobius chulae TaxID=88201 RepID=A0AAW0N740_9GOBI